MAKIETTLSADHVRIMEALVAQTYAVSIGKRSGEATHVPVPLADMPAVAWLKIVGYGAQRVFNDAIGGSDTTTEEKVAKCREMVASYVAGDVGRKVSEGVDAETAEIRTIIRALVRAQVSKEAWETEWKDREDMNEALDAVFAKQPEAKQTAIRETAREQIAERVARKAKLAALSGGVAL